MLSGFGLHVQNAETSQRASRRSGGQRSFSSLLFTYNRLGVLIKGTPSTQSMRSTGTPLLQYLVHLRRARSRVSELHGRSTYWSSLLSSDNAHFAPPGREGKREALLTRRGLHLKDYGEVAAAHDGMALVVIDQAQIFQLMRLSSASRSALITYRGG